jgi:uncharacterized protein (DUF1919 family)
MSKDLDKVMEIVLNTKKKDLKVKVGNIAKFVEKNKEILKSISPNRNWNVWLAKEKRKQLKSTKKPISSNIGGIGKAPVKKRIETGKLNPGIMVKVPKTTPKGEIPQVKANLTEYGKKADRGEAKEISKKSLQKDYTIVSDNCYGVAYMKARGEPYNSPFFSIFIYSPDYITLLENFDEYMKLKPVAQDPEGKSKYRRVISKYPVLLLEGSKGPVEIHYAHEKQGSKEAIRKWTERVERMDKNKKDMFVKMDDRDRFTVALGKRFLQLKQFPTKRLFLSEKYKKSFEGMKNVVFTKYKTQGPIGTTLEKLYPIS